MLKKETRISEDEEGDRLKSQERRLSPGGSFGGEGSHVELVSMVQVSTFRERENVSKCQVAQFRYHRPGKPPLTSLNCIGFPSAHCCGMPFPLLYPSPRTVDFLAPGTVLCLL